MASITCTKSDTFPNGTVVKAYPRSSAHFGQGGAPAGSSVGEATMTSGTLTIEGLTAGQEYTLYAEVAGKDAYLAVQAPATTTSTAATGLPEPGLQGLLASSFDPILASANFQLAVAGTLYKTRIPIKEQIKASNILLFTTTAAAALTAAECFAGLFAEGTRKLLAKATAAEYIAKMEAAAGLQTIPLESAVVLGPGYVDLGQFYNGTTAPKLATAVAQTAALINAGSSGAGRRFATADTALTAALPATMSAVQASVAAPIWVGLS